MTVVEPEMLASERRPVPLAGWDGLIFLHCGIFWVVCAVCLASAIARLALGQVEVPLALLAASWISIIFVMSFTPFVVFVAGGAHSDAKKDPVRIGCLVSMAFMVLGTKYDLVLDLLCVEGSQSEQIGSMARDVGIMGAGATCLFRHHTHYDTEAMEDEVEGYVVVLLRKLLMDGVKMGETNTRADSLLKFVAAHKYRIIVN